MAVLILSRCPVLSPVSSVAGGDIESRLVASAVGKFTAAEDKRRYSHVLTAKGHLGQYLMECEWRFKKSDPAEQIIMLKQWVKKHLRSLSGSAPNFNGVQTRSSPCRVSDVERLRRFKKFRPNQADK